MSCELDCTASCRLVDHGNMLTKCLTKRELSEDKLISFLLLTCANFFRNLDDQGRSALHVACSTSKSMVAEFLLRNGANIQQKDQESLWTPLHRSIHYACLDVVALLRRYGASFDSLDMDFYTPLQLIFQSPKISPAHRQVNCVYVWGKNKNYNLGIGNTTDRSHPDIVKGLPPTLKASINKYHSLFLTSCFKLYGCGHSKEGRLGVGSDVTLTLPQEVEVKMIHRNEKILDVSAGLSHSLILTNKGIYGAGSNKHYQLGLKNVETAMTFKEIPIDKSDIDLSNMLSITACDFYSVFASRNGVFVCGENVGQFGGIQESIPLVRRLPFVILPNLEVHCVASNNSCICVYLEDNKTNYLYIYFNRKVKPYKNPLNEKFKQVVISGGDNSNQKPLTITILTEHNNLYIWYEDIMKFVKMHMSTLFTTQISSISTCGDQLLIIANGHLFETSLQHKVSKMYQLESEYQEYNSRKDIAQFLCSKMKIKRVPHLSNVMKVYCDLSGESFISILSHIAIDVKDPKKEKYDFSSLLDDDPFMSSGVMDVKFTVQGQTFSANRFVVSSRSSWLKDVIEGAANRICDIKDDRLTTEMFRCILLWIYTNQLSEEDLKGVFGLITDVKVLDKLSKNFVDIVNEWKLSGVLNCIKNYRQFAKCEKQDIMKEKAFRWFSMDAFPEFSDVTILLDENQELRVHKVILMMRFEYFKMMFHHSWRESKTIDLRHISINFMRPILRYAYDNDQEALMNANFSDNFMYKMCAILDQYLMENVKIIFESMIMKKVNLRNCTDNLEFAFAYNCHLLKEYCMEFICLNLCRLLEENVFDNLEYSIMDELSRYYRKYFDFETDSNRIITPAFDAPTDEEIEKIIGDFDLSRYSDSIQQTLKKTPRSKNRLSKSEKVKRNYEKDGMKNLQNDEVQVEPPSPTATAEAVAVKETWQKLPEKKDHAKKKMIAAVKCNEIMKNGDTHHEPMINLTNLKHSWSEEPEMSRRSKITLADFGFGIKTKKKSISEVQTPPVGSLETKPAWNMDSIELKPINHDNSSHPLKSSAKNSSAKKKLDSPKPSSFEKNFSSIVRDERKEKTNHEKILSKPLLLTQIEEKAIVELAEFYNIDNIFDESIKISRKVHKTSLNLSQWQHS